MSAELQRKLDNIIRFGVIAEVNHATARARVKSGDILTDFLPFVTFRAGTTKTWSPPTVGEQCVMLSVSGEFTTACILVGLYTQNSPSQSPDEHVIEFADGAKITYNQSSGALVVTGIKTASITAANQIDIDCPAINIKGNVNIDGSLSTTGTSTTKGNISTQGSVTASGDIKGGSISLQNHVHLEQGDGQRTSNAKARYTGETLKNESDHIKQSIADILLTPVGSRIQRREYGSLIPMLIDRPISHTLLLQLAACAVTAINRWEPRVQITQFKPELVEGGIVASYVARSRKDNQEMHNEKLFLGHKQ